MRFTVLLALLLVAGCGASEPEAPAGGAAATPPPDAAPAPTASEPAADQAPRVYFVEPVDGAVVSSPFPVRFGLEGMRVAPAGVDEPGSGHHHLHRHG